MAVELLRAKLRGISEETLRYGVLDGLIVGIKHGASNYVSVLPFRAPDKSGVNASNPQISSFVSRLTKWYLDASRSLPSTTMASRPMPDEDGGCAGNDGSGQIAWARVAR